MPHKTIDGYIKRFPKDVQGILQQVRRVIRSVAPGATEGISYQMPAFKIERKWLVGFAGWDKHIGLYPGGEATSVFKKEVAKYKHAKGSIQFPIDKPMPVALIKKLVRYRVKAVKGTLGNDMKKEWKICSRGHRFQKSSLCPVCPICWPGQRKKLQSDFPEKLGAPALRALHNAKIKNLAQLAKHTEADILELHGMGPKALSMLKPALKKAGYAFKK